MPEIPFQGRPPDVAQLPLPISAWNLWVALQSFTHEVLCHEGADDGYSPASAGQPR